MTMKTATLQYIRTVLIENTYKEANAQYKAGKLLEELEKNGADNELIRKQKEEYEIAQMAYKIAQEALEEFENQEWSEK